MVQISMLTDKWLLRYTPLERLYPKPSRTFKSDLNFDIKSHPGALTLAAWSNDVNAKHASNYDSRTTIMQLPA